MIMIEFIAKLLHCGDKTDRKNRMIGNYGISKDNSHNISYLYPVYHFRYRWVQKLIFKYLDKQYPILFTTHISYNDRVWNRWRRFHNFKYFFHYKYDRPYGMGKHVDIPYRWTINPKFEDRVYHHV